MARMLRRHLKCALSYMALPLRDPRPSVYLPLACTSLKSKHSRSTAECLRPLTIPQHGKNIGAPGGGSVLALSAIREHARLALEAPRGGFNVFGTRATV